MKKERLYYLDFVRAIAVVLILLTHFNARYLSYYMTPSMPQNALLGLYPFGIYIGDLGVSLFFIISGAALMYVYKEELHILKFYKKRFLALYPMFWIGYIFFFLYFFYCTKQMPYINIPKINFLATILGMDGYLTGIVPTYYILGEWFLGCIILMYIAFPLLRIGILKRFKITCIFIILLYLPFATHEWFTNFPSSKLLLVRLPEILFGMIFILYIRKPKIWHLCCSIFILLLNTFLKPNWPTSLQTTYIGICSFIVLVYISKWFTHPLFMSASKTLSKYSYAIFLTHHVIIDEIANTFPMAELNRSERYLLFLLCLIITGLASYLLFHFNAFVVSSIKKCFYSHKD